MYVHMYVCTVLYCTYVATPFCLCAVCAAAGPCGAERPTSGSDMADPLCVPSLHVHWTVQPLGNVCHHW